MISSIVITVLIATIVGSISGIGGGVLIKPVLDAVTSMSASQISFLSGVTVLTMTIVSLFRSRNGEQKISGITVFLAIGAAIGGVAGKNIFDIIKKAAGNDAMVSLIQNILMVILTVMVFIYTLERAKIKTFEVRNKTVVVISGFVLGVFSSFLGIGGGPINLMILSYLFSMDTKTAALNSLFVILFSQILSLVTTIVTGNVPEIDWVMLLLMMCFAVVGATVGRSLSKRMSPRSVDILFMILMAVIIGLSIYNCVRYLIQISVPFSD
ncbi:MAG: sulfite exporter TauE/SafE family protein [Spirochaetales bacterium]|nr:sulfite exporter TauE/SafE family protein [Spirochaetales bacterium]